MRRTERARVSEDLGEERLVGEALFGCGIGDRQGVVTHGGQCQGPGGGLPGKLPAGISLNIAIEASNTLALLGLVAAGLGVTVYPESLIGFLGRSVEVRPIIHPQFRISTVLAWKRSNRSRQVREFVEVAKLAGMR